ncbi:MAG: glucokinase [Chloroflexi bacterium]|nr:glucokinase [Chloroflexota bacterium]MBL6961638.1 glucokinase [Anaerolineales bacterium]
MLLAGDIGGTKTNLAIFTSNDGLRGPLVEATFASGDYPSLEALVGEFLEKNNFPIDHASIGVAGPVIGTRATVTNLSWVMEERQLEKKLKIPSIRLLNDLDAIAHSIPFLDSDDLNTLNAGQPEVEGNLAVVAPGTGLGEAFLTWAGVRYQTYASEGGHADFASTTPLQLDLLRYLQDRYGHVSYERVCSGKGIPNIYNFLKDSGYADEPVWLARELADADDPTPIIVNTALDEEKNCILCSKTLDIFVSILGAEAGNMALKVMATGGIFLGGGIPPRILTALKEPRFIRAFTNKGRFSDLLTNIPVYVICNPKVALLGAACHGLESPHV